MTKLDKKGIIPRANYMIHEGCGNLVIGKIKDEDSRQVTRRSNDPSLLNCASWDDDKDHSSVLNKEPNFELTCSAARDYNSRVSGIAMKAGETGKWRMGFAIFESN